MQKIYIINKMSLTLQNKLENTKNEDLIIVKLGGSVITYKERPLTPNFSTIEKISKIIKEVKKQYKVIIVHGGGSFGHYWSVKYDMHTLPAAYSDEGVAKVRDSMIKLNSIIIEKLMSEGLKPLSVHASSFVFNNEYHKDQVLDIFNMIKNNDLIPVTYGDVVYTTEGKFSILSGDSLMNILSNILKPKFSIFTTNVDGIYDNIDGGNLIPKILIDKNKEVSVSGVPNTEIKISNIQFDVTGGMKRKISESANIVINGTSVYLINGFYPERIIDIISGNDFIGTSINMNEESG